MPATKKTYSADACHSGKRRFAFVLAVFALLLGGLYYAVFRAYALPTVFGLFSLPFSIDAGYRLSGVGGSVPSFLHAFATVLVARALLAGYGWARLNSAAIILAALVGFELFLGTTDVYDLMAILLAVLAAEYTYIALCAGAGNSDLKYGRTAALAPNENTTALHFTERQSTHPSSRPAVRLSSHLPIRLFGLVLISGVLAGGSVYEEPPGCALYDEEGYCEEYKRWGKPVYMSLEKLRSAVVVEAPRSPNRIGRLYLYQSFFFLNEKNEGIHVFDNSNPAEPVNRGFIRIPGNMEIAIRGNFLYADSYIDLITLDLNDPANVHLVSRQEAIFPYDAFQNIPYNVGFRYDDLDQQHGVVVSYQLEGNN
ncbi:MAG: hypothetical protein V3U76_19980 [Granulosicoccus sp.]